MAPLLLPPHYGRKSTMHWMLIPSIYNLLENLALALEGVATPPLFEANCIRMLRNMVRPVNSIEHGTYCLYLLLSGFLVDK
jgi:hypothetical protein